MCFLLVTRERFPLRLTFILLIIPVLVTSCNPAGGVYQEYSGPRTSAAETSLVVAWLTPEGNPPWYRLTPVEDISIPHLDGKYRGPWSHPGKVSVPPGQHDLKVETKHHWDATSLPLSGESRDHDQSYRIQLSFGTSSWPYYCERRWLVTLNVELGAEYRIVRGPIDQPPTVYLVGASGDAKEIPVSVRPYYYSKNNHEWYLK